MQVRQLQTHSNQIGSKGWDIKTQAPQVRWSPLRPCLSMEDPRFPHPCPPGTKMHSWLWKYLLQPPRLQSFPKGLNGFFDGPRGAGVSLQEAAAASAGSQIQRKQASKIPPCSSLPQSSLSHTDQSRSHAQGKWTRSL